MKIISKIVFKMGLGVANGVIVDARILSANKDDKTYNGETLEEVEQVLERLNIPVGDFHYIADSALFTSDNLNKAESRLQFIKPAKKQAKTLVLCGFSLFYF